MPKMLKLVAKFKQLKSCDRYLLIAAFMLLGAVRLGLWLMPFRLLFRFLMQISSPNVSNKIPNTGFHKPNSSPLSSLEGSPKTVHQSYRVARIIWSINMASRCLPGNTKCLARALATQVLMNWHRYVSELHIGVNKTPEGTFRAHAWIEYQGKVIVGNLQDLTQFTPLLAYRGSEQ